MQRSITLLCQGCFLLNTVTGSGKPDRCSTGVQEAILKGAFLEGRRPGAGPDIKAVVSAALEIAMGMAYLHGRDLIHGDLNGGQHPWHTRLTRANAPGRPLSQFLARLGAGNASPSAEPSGSTVGCATRFSNGNEPAKPA